MLNERRMKMTQAFIHMDMNPDGKGCSCKIEGTTFNLMLLLTTCCEKLIESGISPELLKIVVSITEGCNSGKKKGKTNDD